MKHGVVLTARAENHLYGIGDLTDTIDRLLAYRAAGADVVYAPGLVDPGQIERLVKAVDAPVNVLAMRAGPSVPELAALGVRRVSTGGGLARAAYGALLEAGRELHTTGTYEYLASAVSTSELESVLAAGRQPAGETGP
jgi:2-methylisocitrate lyase-like PEP mutase family enzyme